MKFANERKRFKRNAWNRVNKDFQVFVDTSGWIDKGLYKNVKLLYPHIKDVAYGAITLQEFKDCTRGDTLEWLPY